MAIIVAVLLAIAFGAYGENTATNQPPPPKPSGGVLVGNALFYGETQEVSGAVSAIDWRPVSEAGRGFTKMVEISISHPHAIELSGVTTEGERATHVVSHKLGTETWEFFNFEEQDVCSIHLSTGQYHVYLIWAGGFDEDDRCGVVSGEKSEVCVAMGMGR
jgi:hypothetical protein